MRVEIAYAQDNPYYLREGLVLTLLHEITGKEHIRIRLTDSDMAEIVSGFKASDLERG